MREVNGNVSVVDVTWQENSGDGLTDREGVALSSEPPSRHTMPNSLPQLRHCILMMLLSSGSAINEAQ